MIGVRLLRLIVALVAVLATSGAAQAQKPVPYPDALERVNESIDALTRKVWPSVVQVRWARGSSSMPTATL